MGVDSCAATYLAAHPIGQCHAHLQFCLTAEKPNHSRAFATSVQPEHLTKVHPIPNCQIQDEGYLAGSPYFSIPDHSKTVCLCLRLHPQLVPCQQLSVTSRSKHTSVAAQPTASSTLACHTQGMHELALCASLADSSFCRAFKLGRGRWSYNKCTLVLQQASSPSANASDVQQLAVAKAVVASTGGSAGNAQVVALT